MSRSRSIVQTALPPWNETRLKTLSVNELFAFYEACCAGNATLTACCNEPRCADGVDDLLDEIAEEVFMEARRAIVRHLSAMTLETKDEMMDRVQVLAHWTFIDNGLPEETKAIVASLFTLEPIKPVEDLA